VQRVHAPEKAGMVRHFSFYSKFEFALRRL
jgi:hypothetical protein